MKNHQIKTIRSGIVPGGVYGVVVDKTTGKTVFSSRCVTGKDAAKVAKRIARKQTEGVNHA